MSRSEQSVILEICQTFLKDNVPEYIRDAAYYILSEGEVQKINIQEGETWEVQGLIQGEDLQVYTPSLTLTITDRTTRHMCNCSDAFTGICRHVTALALRLVEELRKEQGDPEETPPPVTDWKQSFRNFFSTEMEPEAGHHYLIFRFEPEQGRLLVSFYRGRQNKSGLSTVHTKITLEQIIQNPDWCEFSPQLPHVARQIGQHLEYYGHRVEIPQGLTSWFFWAVRKEYYLLWKDTDKPCRIETMPFALKLKPILDDSGFHFDVLLKREGRQPLPIRAGRSADRVLGEDGSQEDSAVTFHGQMPLWVCYQNSFYPVHTGLYPSLVRNLIYERPVVPYEDISEFLDRVWTRLPASELYEPQQFLKLMEPVFQPATYNPKLFLDEEGSLLTLEIDNIYETRHGEFTLNGPNPDFQTGSYTHEGQTYLVRRHQEEEAQLMAELTAMDFQARSSKLWFLEPEEAIAFLLDSYPKLVDTYRVYGEKALSRYKVRTASSSITAQVVSNEKEKWFSLNIAVEYEGQSLPLEKIWKAWARGKRYVQLKDGSYTNLPEAWLEKLSRKLTALGLDPSKPPQQKFKQFEAPVLDSLLEDLPNASTDSFWNTLCEKIRSFREIRPVDPPAGLNATLRTYQQQGLAYLNFLSEYGFGGILADEMGLGKTVQTLSFIQYMHENRFTGPNLIVVPTSVLPNWEREAEKFVPGLKRLTIYGARREGMFKHIADSHLIITTYALLRRDLEEIEKHEFNTVILDEAQNIKNPNTITARSVRRINARMRLCLSGTPIENNLFELWSLFEFLMPGFLGSQHAFQRGIVKPIKDGDPETLDYLRTRVRPFILRRTKAEVAKDLPPKVESVTCCALEEAQAELYAALARKLRAQVLTDVDEKGLAKSQMSILDALLKLRQICCHPRLLKLDMPGFSTNLPSGKFDAFKDMVLEIVEGGHKVLVFSQFVQMLHIIRQWLEFSRIPFCYLDGASKDRFEQVDRFNTSPDIPIFLISLKAGGTGLNLTSADYVIHYDPWWNPAVESQATDRTHRIGQKRQVFSYKLICQNTVEEKILKLQEAKRGVAEAIIPGQDTWKSLTREDLEMLFEV
ncbi:MULTISPECIES: DEAD/DEAH box helicase [unclassified Desulfovibrio]|uniref:DEAD/DEAH box helicase n=1 Tax=unclassified Desulfovibrio TaxID=2593640 RepID=UPI000F6037BA|nr:MULTISPECIES: DEAD/DEAH box helicase [unclassified Desulfovibrio]RRD71864.1 ATP-dependent helicase [Desulfovibrio sp. OH1209_COT-279]RRD88077.1 ATP-dependent helicase [Desulfovibrio sp. OH1186_COT-070]